ncbi:MAG: gamma-glutamylcyclotransferase family protein [Ferruginibacter sp.]
MSTSCYNLFVYGSLRSGFRNPAYEYLTRYFSYVGEALVKGRFFDNGINPVAIPSEEEHFILGELYTMPGPQEFSWAFEQLDDYEGINTVAGQHALYRRALVDVYRKGENTNAWIYWYNGDVKGLTPIETGDLMKYLHQKNQS